MNTLKRRGTAFLLALFCWLVLSNFNNASAQDKTTAAATEVSTNAKSVEVNHEVQLYLLVASNKSGAGSDLPQALGGLIRQLKPTLPFTNYRLMTTFIDRVRDKGNLNVKGIVGTSIFAASTSAAPTFYQFSLLNIKLTTDASGEQFVQIPRFEFGQRVPVQTSAARNESGASFPVINYEQIGITTEVSLREATPTIIGIMPTGQPDELFVLIASVKRIAAR